MDKKSLVVGIGELLWDVFPDHKQMGGAPCNFAFHASKLGLESLAISAIGKDELGDEIIAKLDGVGLIYDIQRVDYPTGTVKVTLSGDGIPQYEICQPVAWDFIGMKSDYEEIAKQTTAVCFGSLAQRGDVSKATIRSYVNAVPDSALKIFDINLRQQFYSQDLLVDSLKMCNVLKINDDEIKIVARMFGLQGDDQENCEELLHRFQLKMVALTCGTNGSYLITKGETSFRETPKVKVADTVGAGDSFTAAMVVGMLKGKPLNDVHQMAVNLSAFVCTQNGAMPEYDRVEYI
ncbi:carbohydrate kinase family protein [Mangrovibacterium diazotrophicum]|uniref:Fructokinase n=1 Tax=Mangrovibacterium diazotrophicum TaxID=1261403 RepID=A0A419W5L6_9BACT|nr:carbohydrate kinase [Mangrovibacterium diazotrophicum]RKD90735.1 fructokinase [Mangrovibacterium diazotrophicum]